MIDLFGCSEPTPVRPGRPIEVTVSYSWKPGTNLLGLSFPALSHTYQWLCNPLVISFSLLLHTRDFYSYMKGYSYSLLHELAQLFVDFSNYMYFRKLVDLAKCAIMSSCIGNNDVI